MSDEEERDEPSEDERLQRWLQLARRGDASALGCLLDTFRDRLHRQARDDLREDLHARIDASDIVQRTCASAVVHFEDFRGEGPLEFLRWLRQIQRRNLVDEVRRHTGTEKRDAAREIADNEVASPSRFVSPQESPSRLVSREEEVREMEAAIQRLPELQSLVVRLKHLEGLRLREIAEQVGRSEQAVAGLLRRGLRQLRRELETGDRQEN